MPSYKFARTRRSRTLAGRKSRIDIGTCAHLNDCTRFVTLDAGIQTAEQIVSAQKRQLELKQDQRIRERFLGALQVKPCP
ncbi:MAG: hypothetical protein LBE44_00590 [Microbacterium hominis]|nr:hypothetical protein [Microbacterium hominis]